MYFPFNETPFLLYSFNMKRSISMEFAVWFLALPKSAGLSIVAFKYGLFFKTLSFSTVLIFIFGLSNSDHLVFNEINWVKEPLKSVWSM